MFRHVPACSSEAAFNLYTDGAALLSQELGEVLGLMSKHIRLKTLEATEGTEYRVDWHGETPVVQELRQKPAGRLLHEIMHIQAAAQHRRLMEQFFSLQAPHRGSSLPAAPTQGQAASLCPDTLAVTNPSMLAV